MLKIAFSLPYPPQFLDSISIIEKSSKERYGEGHYNGYWVSDTPHWIDKGYTKEEG